ncbi:amino acid ABC transporter substrate-binding protein [Thalassomonas viridans]|uniref:Amino acid ABC transporter substrate-binding protein n=1 Tax=Thalassomonas viridans TaxID=137584 RepID=A0AAE9Z8I0_9GAMM|nr:transporter substrate-binding domain-containing protein [Thalassomonas viridans]WDE07984.1 amino acid ABC transporter substrate-binding protein [Thalassomonas viridans]
MSRIMVKMLFLSALVLGAFYGQARTLSVGWEIWYPYQYRNKAQQLLGADLEILNAVAERAGLKLRYSEMPWRRLMNYVKTGEMDVAMGVSYNDERAKTAYFSAPYRREVIRLFLKKDQLAKFKLDSLADITGSDYMIGIEGGYYYGEAFAGLMQRPEFNAHFREAVDIEGNVLMLVKGQIDGFLVDPNTMQAFRKRYAMEEEFVMHPMVIYQSDIHFLLSKNSVSADEFARFNRALIQLRDNGSLAQILKFWSVN